VAVPSGTVTFLFTDIEGSTRLWQADEVAMRCALERHDALLRSSIEGRGGYVFSTGGDGLGAAFARAGDAVAAALEAQRGLAGEAWPEGAPLRVRMGLHTGEVAERDGDYFGTAVNRAARLMGVAHGGQVVCSQATAALVDAEVALVDLGEHRLRDLDRAMRVFQVGGGSFGALRSLDAFPGNLPRQLSSFVGRERELAKTVQALAEVPVVTLTGVGGVGKTRLAVQAAAEALPHYRDGAWLVELGSVRDEAQVAEAVTGALSLSVAPGARAEDALVEFLRNKQLVLVVDNCEHVIGAAAAVVSSVAESCPGVSILATSREGLAVEGERVIPIPSLGAPPLGSGLSVVAAADSVRLFVDRAVAAAPQFAITSTNAAAVAEVCRRLDGIPLAIELAAARVPTMTPAELASRLDRRFKVLAGGRRGAVDRHQTLRAAIDWSYELLSAPQQVLLARLSVFAGGCTLDAAEAVCSAGPVEADDVLDLLADLVARSLVVAGEEGGGTRYRLLETIRQYGEDHLDADEAEVLRAGHAEHYAQLTEAFFRHIFGPDSAEWFKRVAADGENITTAMDWAVDTDNADIGLRIVASLIWTRVGETTRIDTMPALTLRGATEHPAYPMALVTAAMEAALRVDRETVERCCTEALDALQRLGTPSPELLGAFVASARLFVETTSGFWDAAAEQADRGAELALAAGHPELAAYGLASAAAVRVGGDDPDVIDAATRALALARQSAGPAIIRMALLALAGALAGLDPDRARSLLTEAVQMDTGYEDANPLTQQAILAARLGDWRLTLELARRAIPLAHWAGTGYYLLGLFNVCATALAEQRPETAARLQGAARAVGRSLAAAQPGSAPVPAMARNAGFVPALRRETARRLAGTLGDEQLAQRRHEGEDMNLDQAVTYTIAELDGALADPTFGQS